MHPRSNQSHYERDTKFSKHKDDNLDISKYSNSSNKKSSNASVNFSLEGRILVFDK